MWNLLKLFETLLPSSCFVKYFADLPKTLSRSCFLRAYYIEPVDSNLSEHLDLNSLRARLREKPRTKAGQVRQAWPDIRDLLAAGHSLKDIWAWLNEIGVEVGYARLSHYIGQLRRRDEAARSQTQELRRWMVSAAIESEGQTTAQEQPLEDAPASQARPLRD